MHGGLGRRTDRRRRRTSRRAALVVLSCLAATLLAACTGSSAPHRPGAAHPSSVRPYSSRPNIVYVLTDDLSSDLIRYMPHVVALQQAGMSFNDYTVTDSYCCPSRASIFTGRFPHNTRIFTNSGRTGGFGTFHARGEENQTFATALHGVGYRTAMMGKYLNGYLGYQSRPVKDVNSPMSKYVPPGWDDWMVAGPAYKEYDYNLNENGKVSHYGKQPDDYLTSKLAAKGQQFITSSVDARKPFFLELATFAPHEPYTPAPQDVGTFDTVKAPRNPDFNRVPAHAPAWLAHRPKLTAPEIAHIDADYVLRVESVQAVDRAIGALEQTLVESGQLQNTVFVFNSDNGYHMGDHGLSEGKLTAFDTDVRVPLIMAGPGIRAGSTSNAVVENVDLAPTFETLGGATVPPIVDGHSMVDLLHGDNVRWRTMATIEHEGPRVAPPSDPDRQNRAQGNPPSYRAFRTAKFLYVRYVGDAPEYYDLVKDPNELDNLAPTLSIARLHQLNATLDRLSSCRGTECWTASSAPAP